MITATVAAFAAIELVHLNCMRGGGSDEEIDSEVGIVNFLFTNCGVVIQYS